MVTPRNPHEGPAGAVAGGAARGEERGDGARRARIDALFEHALELSPSERRPFLLASCADDPGQLAEVDELLRLTVTSHGWPSTGGLSARPLWEALAAELELDEKTIAGRLVGRWRLVRELGRGGMGTVYLAERADGQFEQRAALKLVRVGHRSSEVLRRFTQERQILASLEHPNIARLLDGGCTDDGRPFLAMEYVEGLPIDRYCDERGLGVDERLELFLRVARAVQHAHRHLVVHRDVKPSNIVVTEEGDVKLLDFGIAKLVSPMALLGGPLTQEARVLTPEYASPEQVRGETVGIASDVYQLGLLLYELLTGERAQQIPPSRPSALEHAVCETAAPRPSARVRHSATAATCAARRTRRGVLARRLAGDLDGIVLCALRKEPERRYGSVSAMVEDVERHRRGLPIHARPDSLAYRAGKFTARHRLGVAWTLVALVAGAWALAVLTGQRLRAAREAHRAEQVEEILSDLFTFHNPRVLPRPPTARDIVDRGARLIGSELRDQPVSQARLLTQLGRVYNSLGLYDPSVAVLRQALQARERAFGPQSIEVADTLEWLGQSQHYRGDYAQAEVTVRRAMEIRRRLLGEEDPSTISAALELGDLLHTRGKLVEAERTLRRLVTVLRPAGEGNDLARGLRDLGNVLRDRGSRAESALCFREAIRILRQLHGFPDQQVVTAEVYFSRLLIQSGELAEAEHLLAVDLPLLHQIYAGEHPLTGMTLREIGHLRIQQGRFAEAEAALAESQKILRQLLGPDHPTMPRTVVHQAELAWRRGHPRDAAALGEAALTDFSRHGISGLSWALEVCGTVGDALLALGRPLDAAQRTAPCLAIAEQQLVPGDERTARLRSAWTRAQADTSRRQGLATPLAMGARRSP